MRTVRGMSAATQALAVVLLVVVAAGCREEPRAEPLKSLKPAPLPSLAVPGAATPEAPRPASPAEVEVAGPIQGEPLPAAALRVALAGERVRVGAETFEPARLDDATRLAQRVRGHAVLVVPDADTFLVQTSELFTVLRDSAEAVWLAHPDGPVAYPVVLRDEAGFRAWLEEVAPGKLRIIMRADGFELTTSVGKLPGPDPNGPSVPVRAGRQDIVTLRRGLGLLKGRFKTSEDLCLVPSFGMEVAQAARALGANFTAPGEPLFDTLCFVYPTPHQAPESSP